MEIFAWIVLGIIIFIILALLYYLVVGQILFSFVFARKSLSRRVLRKNIEQDLKNYKVDLCWWNKVKFVSVHTQSFDGLKLVGHYHDAQSKNTVIVVHGFGQNYREIQQYCSLFYQKNFNILAVENRAHGDSEGKCVGFGWLDRKDIVSWTEFLNKNNAENKIILFGVSMGASAVCCSAGEKLPKNVEAIIADCPFDNANRQIEFIMRKKHIRGKLIKKHLYSFVKRIHGFDVNQADVIKQVKNTKVPILYIHGKADTFVPSNNSVNLYNSTPSNLRDIYLVENAGHAMSYPVAGVLYEKKIKDFLQSRTTLKI